MSRTTNTVLRPPPDLLNGLRWLLLMANVVFAAWHAVSAQLGSGHYALRLTASVASLAYGALLVSAYRRGTLSLLVDLAAIACLTLTGFGLSTMATFGSAYFTYMTFAQLYPSTPRAVLRVGLSFLSWTAVAIHIMGRFDTGVQGPKLFGLLMASLFPFLLARSLGRLQSSEARFRSLVQNSTDLVVVLGRSLATTYLSPPAEALLGQKSGATFLPLLHPDDQAAAEAALKELIGAPGAHRALEFRLRQPSGAFRECEAVGANLLDDPNVEGVVLNVRDITERKAREAEMAAHKEKLHDARHEIEIAARIQSGLLPVHKTIKDIDVVGVMLPASEVGGDYFDILPTDDGCYVGVGDVAGHGLTAGLIMLMTQSVVSALVRANPNASPKEIITQLNRVLHENIRGRLGKREHVTFNLLKITRDGLVTHAGAHEDLLVRRAVDGNIETFHTAGAWLGAVPDISKSLVEQRIKLSPGDVVLLHTDGITEARNEQREEFGPGRLAQALTQIEADPSARVCYRVMRAVETFSNERTDDRSCVVVRYTGASLSS